MKHRNLPFFVPFAGCPHRCAFCEQLRITGKTPDPTLASELASLDRMLGSCGDISDTENQIAFFGGSFTAIPRERMIALLERANRWMERLPVQSIRISTRPDCIDLEILSVLRAYRVTDVELGIQSMDDAVLASSDRGHTADSVRNAAALLREFGFRFTGQMMIGLPLATPETELATAREICLLGASEARIYPTVVFAGTALYDRTLAGSYTPLTDEQAAERVAPCLEQFRAHGVRVLRIGLHSSEQVTQAPFGPRGGSVGELAMGILYAERIFRDVGTKARGKQLTVLVHPSELSRMTGHGRYALQKLQAALAANAVFARTDASVLPEQPKYEIKGNVSCD